MGGGCLPRFHDCHRSMGRQNEGRSETSRRVGKVKRNVIVEQVAFVLAQKACTNQSQ